MCVAEGDRPQVLNASAPMSPVSSGLPPDGDIVAHEKEASLSHRDERQILLDTDRSFVHYPSGEAYIPHCHTDQIHSGRGGMLMPSCYLKERPTQ